MNTRSLLLTVSLIAIGAFTALPVAAAESVDAPETSVSTTDSNSADNSPDKAEIKDSVKEKETVDATADKTDSKDKPLQLHANAKAAGKGSSVDADGSTDSHAKDSKGDGKSGKDGKGDGKGSTDSHGKADGQGKGHAEGKSGR